MIVWCGLILLFASGAFAAGRLCAQLDLAPSGERLPRWIGGLTLFFGWVLGCGLVVATAADLAGRPWVRVPIIAGVSTAFAIVCAVLVNGRTTTCSATVEQRPRSARFPLWAWAAIALPVAALHGFLLLEAFGRGPEAVDGLRYHLPMVVRWLRDGRLSVVPEIWQYCYPSNGELWLSLFVATRVQWLIEPGMFPFGPLAALCAAGIARELGARTRGACVAALLVLAIPMVALQMYSSYVDLFGTAFLTGSLYWTLRLARPAQTPRSAISAALLAGLSLGIALGSKLSMIVWVAPILLVLGAGVFRLRLHAARLGVVVTFILGTLICSSYWGFRAAREKGWFLYPLQVHVGPWQIGKGVSHAEICADMSRTGWSSIVYPWRETKASGYPYKLDNGLGPMFVTLALAGTAYVVYRRLGRRRSHRLAELAILGWVLFGIVLFVEVCFSYARYVLPLWVVMFATAGPLLDLMLRHRFRTTIVLTSLTLALCCAMVGLWPAKTMLGQWRDARAGVPPEQAVPALVDEFAPGTVILNLNSEVSNYPLLGRRFTNVVWEAMFASVAGLQRQPLSRRQLSELAIDVVYVRGNGPPPFAPDVEYARIYDERESGAPPSRKPARMYRVMNLRTSASSPAECRWARR